MGIFGELGFLDISKLLLKISDLSGFLDHSLKGHNLRVAAISSILAQDISYSKEFLKKVLIASIFHDIGILFQKKVEQKELLFRESSEGTKAIHLHAFLGYELFKRYPKFKEVALAIRDHHRNYSEFLKNPGKYSYTGQIIHLADRIDIFVMNRIKLGWDFPKILFYLKEKLSVSKGRIFDPVLVEILINRYFDKEAFWFYLYTDREEYVEELILSLISNLDLSYKIKEVLQVVDIFGFIIDFKSPFTATHSSGVAQTAAHLSSILGFSPEEVRKMKIAGFLHDIGKIYIPLEILEKPGRLTESEFFIMKSHVFHTYMILKESIGDIDIVKWASYHHEKLNGEGYPFKLKAEELPIGSRIMAVADAFTALTEDRPYKKGIPPEKTVQILEELAQKNALDKRVVYVLKKNLSSINTSKEKVQEKAKELYDRMRQIAYSGEFN
ncbi:HD-GYP domain, c-di-GMP phosphodiesterase class II (or its inactivated variant) [Balnearium lithotrophicum]|uniref:HD-GYP domain, c-di-GMP phosphodiesterase class II (Or its inactivated variant) n=1 Tax=Balnearium lithotrophicum TaxID=223788 RepID=A0A521BW71_9BACT|nr:HD domain-containing phosphohydrolase [Balnearium lithotrophicum]SMO51408.1 HD-GYP domain, c-di-GMP phosphodiesterase class II (or its inactivated variant) [Balnearium lithotrophicum]